MALTALAVLVWRMTAPPEGYLKDVTAGVFATFYVPFLATFVALMLTADDGAERVITFLILTVVADTGAYAVGWRFGKHKLAPRISPGKTREGLFGAVGAAMVSRRPVHAVPDRRRSLVAGAAPGPGGHAAARPWATSANR